MTMQANKRSGSCLCGAVHFDLTLQNTKAHVCHCGMCRKWGAGGPVISVDCDTDVTIHGEENLRWYQSSEWAQRGFCRQCGSSLFYKLVMDGSNYMNVCVAALDNGNDITLKDHIFIDRKPPYYDFADNCPRLTEEEFLAKFAAGNA